MNKPKWSWRIQVKLNEQEQSLVDNPVVGSATAHVEGESDLDTEWDVRSAVRRAYGDSLIKVEWVVPFGEEPQDEPECN